MSIIFTPELEGLFARLDGKATSRPPLAVFDCDGTIIHGDVGEAMFYRQVENFFLRVNPANIWLDHPRRDELDTLYTALASLPPDKRNADRRFVSFAEMMLEWYFDQLAAGKTEKACSDIVRLLARFSESEVQQLARDTVADEFASPIGVRKIGKHSVPRGLRYIAESVALLRELQHRGFDVWAISGSNTWSVHAVFEPLGIPRDHIIGIDLQSSKNTWLPKVNLPVPVLEGKVEALRQFTPIKPTIVVSDSVYDAALFTHATDMRILINSRMENSYTFFKEAHIHHDDSWVVIEKPTLLAAEMQPRLVEDALPTTAPSNG
jgi:phosphoserine phosphatase